MKSVVVGTAGHIDHGKTALVRALTGIDTDRLQEEKRRGITIDLGFAHLELPGAEGGLRLGFVDVPGHERFVRNMLAGIGGIDLVLLVIAADEAIKPQTREHFDICRLLSISRGITVLTKADLVDAETLAVARLEVEELLRGSFLDTARAPMVAVSAKTGAGLDELRRALAEVAAGVASRDSQALPRLPVDRVFTMKGFGTVTTGTLISGTIRKEDELEVFPSGKRVRVRGVQVHGESTDRATAGQRTALNLAGVTTDELARGMMLAPPGCFSATQVVDVRLTLLPTARRLKNRDRVHLYAYSAETIATVRLWDQMRLDAGHTALARLTLDAPLQLLPGDRLIVRQFSPVVTIGGGVVADAHPLRARSARAELSEFLSAMLDGTPEEMIRRRIARRLGGGCTHEDLQRETGWAPRLLQATLAKLVEAGSIRQVGGILVDAAFWNSVLAGLPTLVGKSLAANRLRQGVHKEELRAPRTHPAIFDAALAELIKLRKLEVSGELVRLPGRGVELKDDETAAQKMIEDAFARAGLAVPALKDVLAGLQVDRARAQKIVTLLLRDRVLVKISEELVFHQYALAELRTQVAALKAKSPNMDVGRFKALTGVSRKYAIPLLEYLDRERVTRRVGDERVIL
jgi:selenocysteine-specific elongation factor